jgi:iron complex outermembrane recepter protein
VGRIAARRFEWFYVEPGRSLFALSDQEVMPVSGKTNGAGSLKITMVNARYLRLAALAGALSIVGWHGAEAQTSPPQTALPPVTIDAPQQRATQAKPAQREVRSSRGTRRHRAERRVAAQPAPPAVTPQALERIDGHVDGYVATRTGSGSKTNTPLRELPQTVNVITADQISEQKASARPCAIRRACWRKLMAGPRSSIPTRRFAAFSTVIDPYGLERIEVLKGPSSVLYGQTSLGGIVNMTTKRPTDTPFGEIQLQTGSFDRKQVAFDFGGPTDASKQLLYRFTGLVRDADTRSIS